MALYLPSMRRYVNTKRKYIIPPNGRLIKVPPFSLTSGGLQDGQAWSLRRLSFLMWQSRLSTCPGDRPGRRGLVQVRHANGLMWSTSNRPATTTLNAGFQLVAVKCLHYGPLDHLTMFIGPLTLAPTHPASPLYDRTCARLG